MRSLVDVFNHHPKEHQELEIIDGPPAINVGFLDVCYDALLVIG